MDENGIVPLVLTTIIGRSSWSRFFHAQYLLDTYRNLTVSSAGVRPHRREELQHHNARQRTRLLDGQYGRWRDMVVRSVTHMMSIVSMGILKEICSLSSQLKIIISNSTGKFVFHNSGKYKWFCFFRSSRTIHEKIKFSRIIAWLRWVILCDCRWNWTSVGRCTESSKAMAAIPSTINCLCRSCSHSEHSLCPWSSRYGRRRGTVSGSKRQNTVGLREG